MRTPRIRRTSRTARLSPVTPLAAPTIGVEEELTLLDPGSGRVAPYAAEVVGRCHDRTTVDAESVPYVVETRTPVCDGFADVLEHVRRSRLQVSAAAASSGAVLAATGLAPFGLPDPPLVTHTARYEELARRFPGPMSVGGTCACHVHVGLPSREVGVQVLLRLRRWLPVLAALMANSPIWEGEARGAASHRLGLVARWPTGLPAPPVESLTAYERALERAVSTGRALDTRSIYFFARLSPRYPTIEVRLADVALSAEESAAYAALVRALVAAEWADLIAGIAPVPVPQPRLRAACHRAAESGMADLVPDPRSGRPLPAWTALDALLARVRPWLRAYGDEAAVVAVLDTLRVVGAGAQRQRRLLAEAPTPGAYVAALGEATTGGLVLGQPLLPA